MAKWPKGTEPDPERYTVDMIVDHFWENRPRGRKYQSLEEDVAFFLPGWVPSAGRENVIEAWKRIMARKDEDLAEGGKPHTGDGFVNQIRGRGPPPPPPREKGLRVYG